MITIDSNPTSKHPNDSYKYSVVTLETTIKIIHQNIRNLIELPTEKYKNLTRNQRRSINIKSNLNIIIVNIISTVIAIFIILITTIIVQSPYQRMDIKNK